MVLTLGICLLLAQAAPSLDQLSWIAGQWQGKWIWGRT
jgi:hypothetical protein